MAGDDPAYVVYARIAIYVAASFLLAWECRRFLDSGALALGALVLLNIHLYPWRLHHAVMTDSLFASLSVILLAPMFRWFGTVGDERSRDPGAAGSLTLLAGMSAAVGTAIAVRPVGWAYAPLIPFVVLVSTADARRLGSRSWARAPLIAAAAIAPLAACVFLEADAYHRRHGHEKATLAGGTLLERLP